MLWNWMKDSYHTEEVVISSIYLVLASITLILLLFNVYFYVLRSKKFRIKSMIVLYLVMMINLALIIANQIVKITNQ